MIFSRVQGGSCDGIDSHKWNSYKSIFTKYSNIILLAGIEGVSYDLFARDCLWADVTNDLNPNTKASINLDAETFIKNTKSNVANLILFDPPFSGRQAQDKYGSDNLYASDSGKISRITNEFQRVLKPGGYVIKLGYNSTKIKNLEIVEMVIVNFGGSRNDVIISVHKKMNQTLGDF
tara:strand:+ start:681 stop:1211 length:531 start_codon:yes stop_codon:yes gene_type:complete